MLISELRNVMKPVKAGLWLLLFLSLCCFALFAQTRKILVETDSDELVKDLQSASSQVRVVAVTKANAMPPQDPALWRAHGMELLGPPLPIE